ncbi:MAG: carboxypeptidase regulatory-like domain-containing protein [Anaerolineae bacterium]|nr:carboxypeptidase regulatory-like domain-containing protein [Anaerolineae bacterium]MDW8099243.1 carboxypeptidase regulatory-like domain-containing protein [Anaerolineae bacterium]
MIGLALLVTTALLFGMAFAVNQVSAGQAAPPTPSPSPAMGRLFGFVRDAAGPVAGAIVRVQATENKTTTADDGSFTLSGISPTGLISVTAWAPGYYVGLVTTTLTTIPVTITLKRYYTTDNPDYDWFSLEDVTGSAACGKCHVQYSEWKADAHAQAAVNPRFLTMYTGADVHGNKGQLTRRDTQGNVLPPDPAQPYYGPGFRLDYPNRAGNCATCHTPLASKIPNTQNCGWSGCHTDVTTEWSQGIIPRAPTPLDLTGDAAEGITCDFCHKIGDVYLNPKTGLPYPDMPGILSMRLYRPKEGEQLFFGTFDDVPEPDTYLPLLEESAFCAPCHYGVFGGVVGSGDVKDGVLIYNSYGEWLESPYSDPETGKTCQDCHMPPVDYQYFVFPEMGGLPRDPSRIHNHRMPGASDETLLQNAVTMTTTAQLQGDQVLVEVRITNDKTGHHVPTDSPLRHLILVVQATDAKGNRLPLRAGPVLPDWAGDYAGQPGRTYAKILRDEWTGETPTGAYWRPVRIVADTRLAAFATDVSRYAFSAPAGQPITVEARLIFRRAFQPLARLKGWDDPDIVMEQAKITIHPIRE